MPEPESGPLRGCPQRGPVSQGVLSYSQSTNPDSPHAADQTRLYSRKGWDDLRFTEAAVRRDAVLRGR